MVHTFERWKYFRTNLNVVLRIRGTFLSFCVSILSNICVSSLFEGVFIINSTVFDRDWIQNLFIDLTASHFEHATMRKRHAKSCLTNSAS